MCANKYGWKPDYKIIERHVSESKLFDDAFGDEYIERDTFLYEFLLWRRPNYRRGNQGIGDCVAWGTELCCTILLDKAAYRAGDPDMPIEEAATEPIYSGSRVEARGYSGAGDSPYGGWQDGSFGSAAAKWVRDWGVLLRKDYSGITGQADDDLRVYSADKSKQWGAYGCGGKNDQGRMDKLAREKPIKEYSQCRSFEDVARCICALQCPVIVGSSSGFNMALDNDGFWTPSGTWYHLMAFIGVRFGRRPGALIAQSWGPESTTNLQNRWPETMPSNIAGFTGWVDADVVTSMCRQDDAFGLIESSFKTDKLDFSW